MNREKIVEHVKAKDRVIFWTASDLYFRYWVYDPKKDRVTYVVETCSIPEKIKWIANKEGLKGGIWVRGLAGIAALFPVVGCSDEVAEQMLLATLPKVVEEPRIIMTAQEQRYADQVIQGHFEEDRNEFRMYRWSTVTSSGTGAGPHQQQQAILGQE